MDHTSFDESGSASWIASLMKQLREEVRVAPLGIAARRRVAEMQDRSVSGPERDLATDVVDELKGRTLRFGDRESPEVDSGVGQTRGLSRRTRHLSRVDRVRVSRVDRLLRNIETAQFGQEMVAQQKEKKSGKAEKGGDITRSGSAKVGRQSENSTETVLAHNSTETVLAHTAVMDTGDFMTDFIRLPRSSAPPGSVSLDVCCDEHGGRLMRLWMSRQAKGATLFGGEGRNDAWATDSGGRGAVLVMCTRQGCQRNARLTNDWLVGRLMHVRAEFEAGQGLPVAQIPLSEVGVF